MKTKVILSILFLSEDKVSFTEIPGKLKIASLRYIRFINR
tara:strand:- start:913 stop:1032 length:120 start_codon:yes stop_codon:yes gene_type:complete